MKIYEKKLSEAVEISEKLSESFLFARLFTLL
jgi:hypothetical protein